jgi:hypothetical protein
MVTPSTSLSLELDHITSRLCEFVHGIFQSFRRASRVCTSAALDSVAQQIGDVLLSSHLLHEVEQICNRVAIIYEGRLLSQPGGGLIAEDNWIKLRVDRGTEAYALLSRNRDFPSAGTAANLST